jgi:hypothetical protein
MSCSACSSASGLARVSPASSKTAESSGCTSGTSAPFGPRTGSGGAGASMGVGATSAGVAGGLTFASLDRRASRFFSSVLRKTLIVVRRDLRGLQSSAATGVCSQTGHEEGRFDWPIVNH